MSVGMSTVVGGHRCAVHHHVYRCVRTPIREKVQAMAARGRVEVNFAKVRQLRDGVPSDTGPATLAFGGERNIRNVPLT
jgi:hypothetical protein